MVNVKTVIAFLAGVYAAYEQANADGKINFQDIGVLIPLGIQIPALASAAPLAFEEWKQATSEMRDALQHQLNDELKFPIGLTHERIEAGLNILIEAGVFLKK
ncbi:MAG: hypothetical protein EOO77_05360 [Oxalobacteraceae bacterium]|nr:MAG: hypothetical protein EOO77_05360 [Oxalobacteraceae bacterium]